jgi:cytochrome c peroxidase
MEPKPADTRSMPWRAATAFLIALALAALWWFGVPFFEPQGSAWIEPPSLYPPQTAEPVAPIPRTLPLDNRKVALGNRLFHDPRLSRDNSVACASCHDLGKGGGDGLRASVGIGNQRGDVNAPTVFNSGFNFRQFWNGRAQSLEDQIDGPIHNPKELGSNWPQIVAKLEQDAVYAREFAVLYRDGIKPENIKDAIATFERSLLTPDSRFDKYLRGERQALTRAEIEGYELFKSYGCISCHQGVNVGGNLFERLGVVRDYFQGRGQVSPADLGRFAITGAPEDRHVFKVPSLRNVALTAPYFHDGSVPTLEEAVVAMGKYQLGVVIPPDEVSLIVQYLRTLTGEYDGKPL